jgi:hypothetical protein
MSSRVHGSARLRIVIEWHHRLHVRWASQPMAVTGNCARMCTDDDEGFRMRRRQTFAHFRRKV